MIKGVFFRIRAVFFRVLHQMIKDAYMLTMMCLGPLVTFWLLFVVFQESTSPISLGVVSPKQEKTPTRVDFLTSSFSLNYFSSEEEGIKALNDGKLPALLILKKNLKDTPIRLILEGTEPLKDQKIILALFRGFVQEVRKDVQKSFIAESRKYESRLGLREFQKALKDNDQKTLQILGDRLQNMDLTKSPPFPEWRTIPDSPENLFQISYLFGKKLSYFDSIAPTLVSFLIFFVVFLVGGIAFLRERTTKTLSRTFATPIQDWQFILGYFLAFAVIILILVVALQFFSIQGLGVVNQGSFFLLFVVNLLVSFVGLVMGFIFSTLAKTEFQLVQWIPLVIIPQFIFSGIFDTSVLPPYINELGKLFPLYYASHALVDISIRGRGLSFIWPALLQLCLFLLSLIILNSLLLRKTRRQEG